MGPTADGVSDLDLKTRASSGRPEPQESPLTHSEIQAFRQSLEQLREWLLASIAELEAKQQAAGSRTVSGDVADAAFQNSIKQRAIAEKRLLLHEVMQSFERIKDNTYGQCVTDAAPIPRTLLEEVPWARFCASCAGRELSNH